MKNEFLLGCNYWASNSGCNMWREWDEQTVRRDIEKIAASSMKCLRIFPNWEDFQPVIPVYGAGGEIIRYAMKDGSRCTNNWYIDEEMMRRFKVFCDIAEQNNIKLIVGLVTGWMSGMLFIPPALYNVNLFNDAKALLFQQKFVKGFVSYMKGHNAIIAWDQGNECECMCKVSDEELVNWSEMISNAIRSEDNSRPVISGLHTFYFGDKFKLMDELSGIDIFVTHPYPLWGDHSANHPILKMKTLLHAAAQTAFFRDISEKPCLVEEIGTMGPIICSEQASANFLRINTLHAYLYGHLGLLWWNAFDQDFDFSPYLENACERELGMFRLNGEKKKFTEQMEFLSQKKMPKISGYHKDAVIIITKGCDAWKTAFGAFMLAIQAGISIKFANGEKAIPKADAYILPNISSVVNLDKDRYDELKGYVKDGSKLLITMGDGFLSGFNELTGLEICDSAGNYDLSFELCGEKISGKAKRQKFYKDTENGIFENAFGKGKVFTLDFSPENTLFDNEDCENSNYYKIYRYVFKEEIENHPIDIDDSEIGIIWHKNDGLCSIINYSDKPKQIEGKTVSPFDAVIIEV